MNARAVWPAVAGVLAATASVTLLWHGAILNPDSWAYWEGSVSLLSGNGYRFFGGEPIVSWPPVFSLLLAGAQRLGGVSGAVLAATLVVIVSLAAVAWTTALEAMWPDSLPTPLRLGGIVALCAGLACWSRELMAHPLALLVLGALGILLVGGDLSSWRIRVAASALAIFLPLIHASMLVLIPGIWTWAALAREDGLMRGYRTNIWVPLSALVSAAVLAWLGMLGGHPLGGATPPYSAAEYARQAVDALASLLGPSRFGGGRWMLLIALVLAVAVWREDRRWRGPLCVIAFSVPALVLLFSVTWVQEPLSGRFVVFAWPILIGVAVRAAVLSNVPLRSIATLLLAATVAIQLERVGLWVGHPGTTTYPERAAWTMTIEPSYVFGAPERQGTRLLVAPPTYPWQARARTPRQ